MEISDKAMAIIADIDRDLQHAATDILALTLTGMEVMRRPGSEAVDLAEVFTSLLEASCFQDITGQKLDQLKALLTGEVDRRPNSELLNGPAVGSAGLDQDAADRLFSEPPAALNG